MKSRTTGAAGRWLASAVLVLAVGPGLDAQEPLGTDVPELRARAEQLRAMVQSRARIGLVLGDAQQVGGRTGVAVQRVMDGGPAARAGVRAGDVVLSLNDVDLGERPARRLTALMSEVEPGDTVSLRIHRDGRDETVRVVADRGGPAMVRFVEGTPGDTPIFDAGPIVERLRGMRPVVIRFGGHGLDLVAMNPRLGRYFGAERGVLVADVAAESTLGLEPGDVILSIDGRAVQDAAHARSILSSYRTDEEIRFEVVRDRRTITVRGAPRTGRQ